MIRVIPPISSGRSLGALAQLVSGKRLISVRFWVRLPGAPLVLQRFIFKKGDIICPLELLKVVITDLVSKFLQLQELLVQSEHQFILRKELTILLIFISRFL